jgi:hypothetical protein
LTAAIVSLESRTHTHVWHHVAALRGAACDSLASLMSKPLIQTLTYKEPLTADMGWLMERLMELLSIPDLVVSLSPESQTLMNYDKRR